MYTIVISLYSILPGCRGRDGCLYIYLDAGEASDLYTYRALWQYDFTSPQGIATQIELSGYLFPSVQ
jgi:hypothetical protein